MEQIELTNTEARRLILVHQGLWPPREASGKGTILDTIERLGCIQYDPLNIVGRNPDLVLQARISDYNPAMLDSLLYEERHLLDGWDKNQAIYLTQDWPFFQRYREAELKRLGDSSRPAISILPQVREAIEKDGPLSSIDLSFDKTVDWSWGPTRMARAALESMYSWGELIIHHRVNTRKVYDFAYRHLPSEILVAADPNRTDDHFDDWRIERRAGGIGLIPNRSGDAWLGISGLKAKEREAAFSRLLAAGRLVEVSVEGFKTPLYLRHQALENLEIAKSDKSVELRAAILAPLDNLLWDRRLVKELFDFYYVWEVYKPAAERLFGYYVLPILYGDRFIARFEPALDRNSGDLMIKNWWWEDGVTLTAQIRSAVNDCFSRFMYFLGTGSLTLTDHVREQAGIDWLAATREPR
jgi:hypothetical protein